MIGVRRIPSLTAAMTRWGPTFAAPYAAAALATPHRTAVIDDHGTVTFSEVDRASTAVAKGLAALGVRRGQRLGIACFNHRDAVEAIVASAKLATVPVLLNTSFAGPQLDEVLDREDVDALVIDESLAPLLDDGIFDGPVVLADTSPDRADDGRPTSATLRRTGRLSPPLFASAPQQPVLLTSGTTGVPKGARRSARPDLTTATAVIGEIPFRHDDTVMITSPVFHAWGFAQLGLAAVFGSTVVLSHRFDAEATLQRIERDRVTVLVVVPTILQRLLASPALDSTDLSSLRIVASSGSALPPSVVTEWFERVGPNLYNLYGSTEVGQATLATPTDLVDLPATAGRPLPGSVVRLFDESGREVPQGEVGRIFVGNSAQFDEYTGGGTKEMVDGLMSSGDVGYLDADGRLFVTGRADDMIVSGGENVFPREIEELLLTLDAVTDVAVVGVPDDDFGQRLVAHVVAAPGAEIDADDVRTAVSTRLARHKVPRDVVFVDELPRTATGKLRRGDLV